MIEPKAISYNLTLDIFLSICTLSSLGRDSLLKIDKNLPFFEISGVSLVDYDVCFCCGISIRTHSLPYTHTHVRDAT